MSMGPTHISLPAINWPASICVNEIQSPPAISAKDKMIPMNFRTVMGIHEMAGGWVHRTGGGLNQSFEKFTRRLPVVESFFTATSQHLEPARTFKTALASASSDAAFGCARDENLKTDSVTKKGT
jgi:hypothetical protein